jgi:hypothetical protein
MVVYGRGVVLQELLFGGLLEGHLDALVHILSLGGLL